MKLINVKKMNKKFVLESFQAYLDIELNPLNEDKPSRPEINPDSVIGLVDKMLAKQREQGKVNFNFKKFTTEADPYAAWKASQGSTPLEEGGYKYAAAFAAPYLFDKLTDEQKKDLYEGISKNLNDSGYKSIAEVEKLIAGKANLISPPVIYITSKETKIPGPLIKLEGTPTVYQLIEEVDEHGIFKDNEWELKDTSFGSPETKAKLVDPIKEFVSDFASGRVNNIEYIVIQSSASRYRNTGISEGISWGELSFNRTKTIAAIFKAVADEYKLTDQQRTLLQSKIFVDYGGSNGDGTSGPNPINPIAFGYYNEEGKFIQNNGSYDKKRSTVVIDRIDSGGEPTGEIITKTIEPDKDKADYEKYKYVNVVIKASIIEDIDNPIYIPSEDETVEYNPGFKMPRKPGNPPKKKGSPRRRIIGTPGKGQAKGVCPYQF